MRASGGSRSRRIRRVSFARVFMRKVILIDGDIRTVEGLARYVPQWRETVGRRGPVRTFTIASLNGIPAVRRSWSTFGDRGATEPEQSDIYSIPLDNEMFVDVGFRIRRWEGGRDKEAKWKPKAEAARDAI